MKERQPEWLISGQAESSREIPAQTGPLIATNAHVISDAHTVCIVFIDVHLAQRAGGVGAWLVTQNFEGPFSAESRRPRDERRPPAALDGKAEFFKPKPSFTNIFQFT